MERIKRVALVTGAGNGIGREISLRLARDGAVVVVADMDVDAADSVAKAIEGAGGRARAVRLDVTDPEQVSSVVEETATDLGSVDVLVNNAGITSDNFLEKLELSQWDSVMDVNLKGPFLCTKAVAPFMRRNGYGRVVNVSSVAAVAGALTCVNYCASKAGVLGLTVGVAREFGRYVAKDGVDMTCNAVLPGIVETRLSAVMPDSVRERRIIDTPLHRIGKPQDVADVVAFFASEDSRFVTGTALRVDGGLRMAIG